MKKYENIKNVVFVYSIYDNKTIEKLEKFYFKHTGQFYSFKNFAHYGGGLAFCLLYLPLGRIEGINITVAHLVNPKFGYGEIDKFISWYEDEYLLFKDIEIIKHIPHSSIDSPNNSWTTMDLDYHIYNLKMSDIYIDQLFKNVEGIEIKAKYTRLYCDVEKYRDDSMEEMSKYGMGYIYNKFYDGKNLYRYKLDKEKIEIDKYYDYYHNKLRYETKKIISSGKDVLILDIHSFSDSQASKFCKDGNFPDICIGINDDNVNYRILRQIIKRIRKKGFTYKINYPYKGSIIPSNLTSSEEKHVFSVMIEVNKRIYL